MWQERGKLREKLPSPPSSQSGLLNSYMGTGMADAPAIFSGWQLEMFKSLTWKQTQADSPEMEKGKQESIYRPYIGDYIEHKFQEIHYFLPQDLFKVNFFELLNWMSDMFHLAEKKQTHKNLSKKRFYSTSQNFEVKRNEENVTPQNNWRLGICCMEDCYCLPQPSEKGC